MWYSALDVARYVITVCSEAGKPIGNLKLQKMLYFLWVDFYRKTGRFLYLDDICAWQLGPVVPEVYYQYCSYGGRPIYAQYVSAIESADEDILNAIINQYIDVPAHELVDRTHEQGTAWDSIYKNGIGNRNPIPFSVIIAKEVENNARG